MSDISYTGGYVGIGSTAPQAKLHLLQVGPGYPVPAHTEIGGSVGNRALLQGPEPGLMLSSDVDGTTGVPSGQEASFLGLQIGTFAGEVRNQLVYAGQPLHVTQGTPNGSAMNVRMTLDTQGNVGIGTSAPAARLDVAGDVRVYGYSVSASINVRALIPKTAADTYCPQNTSAIYVPWSLRGQTGVAICGANVRPLKSCDSVKAVIMKMDNSHFARPPDDLQCNDPVHHPWPWGDDDAVNPTTLGDEWYYGSVHVVCCK